MGYNSVVSGHLKSKGISRVDGLSIRPLDLRRHSSFSRVVDARDYGTVEAVV